MARKSKHQSTAASAVGPAVRPAPEPRRLSASRDDTAKPPPRSTSEWLAPIAPAIAITALCLIVYLTTVAPTITLENSGIDGGDFAIAALTLGVPHPTGYPLYTMLGYLATRVPLGDAAYRLNVLSAVFGALSIGVTFLVARRLVLLGWPEERRRATLTATLGALTLAFAPQFWAQTTVADVYTLHVLLVASVLLLLVEWYDDRSRDRLLVAGAFVTGLAAANHITSLAIGTAAIALVGLTAPSRLREPKLVAGAVVAFGLGLVPYVYLPIRGWQGAAYVWGDPTTLGGLFDILTGASYRHNLTTQPGADTGLRLTNIAWFTVEQLGWTGLGLVVAGAGAWLRFARPWLVAAVVYCVPVVAFVSVYRTFDSGIYLLPVYLVLALLLSVGAHLVTREVASGLGAGLGGGRRRSGSSAVLTWLPMLVLALALPVAALVVNHPRVDSSTDRKAYDDASRILDGLPERSVLVVSDAYLFTISYLQYVEGRRPDVALVHPNLIQHVWYVERLRRFYPHLSLPAEPGPVELRTIAQSNGERPLFVTQGVRSRRGFTTEPAGPVQRLRYDGS